MEDALFGLREGKWQPSLFLSALFCLNCCRTDIEILSNMSVRLPSTLLIGSAFPIFPSFNVLSASYSLTPVSEYNIVLCDYSSDTRIHSFIQCTKFVTESPFLCEGLDRNFVICSAKFHFIAHHAKERVHRSPSNNVSLDPDHMKSEEVSPSHHCQWG